MFNCVARFDILKWGSFLLVASSVTTFLARLGIPSPAANQERGPWILVATCRSICGGYCCCCCCCCCCCPALMFARKASCIRPPPVPSPIPSPPFVPFCSPTVADRREWQRCCGPRNPLIMIIFWLNKHSIAYLPTLLAGVIYRALWFCLSNGSDFLLSWIRSLNMGSVTQYFNHWHLWPLKFFLLRLQ